MTFLKTLTKNSNNHYYYSNFQYRRKDTEEKKIQSRFGHFAERENRLIKRRK